MEPRLIVPSRRLALPFKMTGNNMDPRISPVRKRDSAVSGVLSLTDREIVSATSAVVDLGDGVFDGNDAHLYANFAAIPGEWYINAPDIGIGDYCEFKYDLISGVLDFSPGGGAVAAGQWSFTDASQGDINAFNNLYQPGAQWQKTSNGIAVIRIYVRFIPSLLPNIYSTIEEEVSGVITLNNT